MSKTKALFFIPARGGSKGIIKKNLELINGLPLVAYSIISASKSKYCSRVIVSTDDEEIKKVSEKFGAEVPFMRPENLSLDTTPTSEVRNHLINWIEREGISNYDYFVQLQATSPFITWEDINNAFELMLLKDGNAIIGVTESEINFMFVDYIDEEKRMDKFFYKLDNLKSVRRQDFNKQYRICGGISIGTWEYVKLKKTFHSKDTFAYIIPKERSLDIDEPIDLIFAKCLIEKKIINFNYWQ